jgi:hypothetical protein
LQTPLSRATFGLFMFGALCLREFSHGAGPQLLGGILGVLGLSTLAFRLFFSDSIPLSADQLFLQVSLPLIPLKICNP